ncbi:MAG: LysM peptidoglycan-binding domain-containing protein [Gammaproteobacteria bacterium]|jgi:membrane-bound lytic murein transglycosylase D
MLTVSSNSLNLKQIRGLYPYPQCLITPVIILLLVVISAIPRGEELSNYLFTGKLKIFQTNSRGAAIDDTDDQQVISVSTNDVEEAPSKSTVDALLERTRELLGIKDDPSLDLWKRLRDGFDLSGYEHPRVDAQLNWYIKNQRYLDRVTARALPYLYYILREVQDRGMPAEIALLPVVESAFQPFAFSSGRAAGIWQFIPATGKRYGLKLNWWYDGRRDVYASTKAALDYLEYLNKLFKGDWLLALAAYNSGEGTVGRAIRRAAKEGKPINFWALDLPKETRDYVPRLLAIAALVADPEYYHVKLNPIPYTPYFRKVDTKGQIDLAKAAELADISIEELYRLNPAFNRWATPPKGPNYLLVPIENASLFKQNLAEYKPDERIRWKRHVVKSNESLHTIASSNDTTIDILKRINKLESAKIASGKSLVIPVAPKGLTRYLASLDKKHVDANITSNPRQKISHTVASGDSLWGISQEYNVSMSKLAKWNHMDQDDVLIAGRKLVIWTNDGLQDNDLMDALIPTTFAEPPRRSITRRVKYRVRRGDSLAIISQRFKVSVPQLLSWNDNIQQDEFLRPGQPITLFVDVTRQSDNI